MNDSWYKLEADQLILYLYIQPGAKKTEICGLHGQSLKIKLAAPPVDGKANKALIKFLAVKLGVALSAISLRAGEKSRTKTVGVQSANMETLLNHFKQLFSIE
ncbi:hypothetical protein Lbir_0945 [Legionella birminghamensis]|uniref:UPF0235 protein Lbir_0945 n=1 Tax=Legionella birminghamensis TaxID=28083 RepID=A0A378I5I8_9GAMM|nr:DUF167 domain-containing protein [Legionella birminghamensis]KTC73889.1 hypothetical protein Lbir_0945 [Legionella birminghamensis]STX30467.1 Uncharacterised ACR, YggU family COG1872 [Legionella birminghamensis]